MAALQRVETSAGPVAFGGRTITLVARTTAVKIGQDRFGAVHARSRPLHVEVLDERGERHVLRVRDIERTVVGVVALAGLVGACVVRGIRGAGDRAGTTRRRAR